MPAAALPDNVLRARYDALGPIEELPGERTIRSRCATFDSMVDYGPLIAEQIATLRARAASKDPDAWPENAASTLAAMEADHPGLFALVDAAWPNVPPREY
jgi:hypothetical protein